MDNFTFFNPTKILFGKGQITALKNEIPKKSRILMLYGKGSIKSNGIYDQVIQELHGYHLVELGGILPNPTYAQALQAIELIKTNQLDFILAVGGGSVIDAAKFISVGAFLQDPWENLKNQKYNGQLPLGVVLTHPATGSEMNCGYVVTHNEDKRAFLTPPVYPLFSILDPSVIASLSKQQIANGLVDSYVHVIEQYLTYPVNAALQDGFAEAILKTLIEIGPKIVNNPKDYDLAANFMWCTTLACNGLIGRGVPHDWATHLIGHELTALYGMDHAATLAIILPAIMRMQQEQKVEKLCQYAKNVWNIDGKIKQETVNAVIEKTENFFISLGMKTRWSEHGIEDALDTIIPKILRNKGYLPLGERQDINEAQVSQAMQLSK